MAVEKNEKNDGKIEKKTGFFPSLQNTTGNENEIYWAQKAFLFPKIILETLRGSDNVL